MATRSITGSFISRINATAGEPVALVVGNGIHQFNATGAGNSWNDLIQKMAASHGLRLGSHASNLALTELYDLIDLKLPATAKSQSLQEEFCASMGNWSPAPHHQWITAWAQSNGAPILTTNFDTVLSDAAGAQLHTMFERHGLLKGPTDYYPWEKYFSLTPMTGPCDRFGVWHINGFVTHVRSIRLGLTHYMGSVSRARPWMHGDKETRLFTEKNMPNWRGRHSWLHIVFNMPLVIFGLQLGAQEVFLRWLLIERARYFRQFPHRRKSAWYVHPVSEGSADDLAKYFFLEALGITPVATSGYDAIYDQAVWQS